MKMLKMILYNFQIKYNNKISKLIICKVNQKYKTYKEVNFMIKMSLNNKKHKTKFK